MTRTSDWEPLLWMLAYIGPTTMVWCGAIVFCFLRRRENPKGAIYLSLAILTQFAGMTLSYVIPVILEFYGVKVYSMEYFFYFRYAFSVGGSVICWIFVTMAVFARPMHYDFLNQPEFDDEQF